jgi:hypothetical protein
LTSGDEDAGFREYGPGSAVNASAVDDWEKKSEKGRENRISLSPLYLQKSLAN